MSAGARVAINKTRHRKASPRRRPPLLTCMFRSLPTQARSNLSMDRCLDHVFFLSRRCRVGFELEDRFAHTKRLFLVFLHPRGPWTKDPPRRVSGLPLCFMFCVLPFHLFFFLFFFFFPSSFNHISAVFLFVELLLCVCRCRFPFLHRNGSSRFLSTLRLPLECSAVFPVVAAEDTFPIAGVVTRGSRGNPIPRIHLGSKHAFVTRTSGSYC